MNFDDKEKILQAFERKSKSFQGSKTQQDSALFTSDIQGQKTVDTKHPAETSSAPHSGRGHLFNGCI